MQNWVHWAGAVESEVEPCCKFYLSRTALTALFWWY